MHENLAKSSYIVYMSSWCHVKDKQIAECTESYNSESEELKQLNAKLTAEIKKTNSRDAGYASEAQKILSMVKVITHTFKATR